MDTLVTHASLHCGSMGRTASGLSARRRHPLSQWWHGNGNSSALSATLINNCAVEASTSHSRIRHHNIMQAEGHRCDDEAQHGTAN